MTSVVGNMGSPPRMYAAKKEVDISLAHVAQNTFPYFPVASQRPFLNNTEDVPSIGPNMWRRFGLAAPGNPDPPWEENLDAHSPDPLALAWVGSQKKCYVAVNSSTVDTPIKQRLYVCDEFFSRATLLRAGWDSVEDILFGPLYKAAQMVHFVDATLGVEGLCVYSVATHPSVDNRILHWFDFTGSPRPHADLDAVRITFDQAISGPTSNRTDLLYLSRGPDDLFGGIIATEREEEYTTTTLSTVTYRIRVGHELVSLAAETWAPNAALQTYFGQLCFDQAGDRILYPENALAYDSVTGGFTQVSSRIKQIVRNNPAGEWIVANTTISTLIELPIDFFEPDPVDEPGVYVPELQPLCVWTNELDGGIYVWLGNLAALPTTSGLNGIVRYDSSGANPVVVTDRGFEAPRWGGSAARGGGGFNKGDHISFGPGCRAPWEN